jgi:NADH dehydrogenase
MAQRLVIVGAGFAGMYAALSAARLRDASRVSVRDLEIALVAPEPNLVVRPRLYEPNPEKVTAPLGGVLRAIDVGYVQGIVDTIDAGGCAIEIARPNDSRRIMTYDRLVLATGSRLFRPALPGLAEHGFSVDQLEDAVALDRHLHGLAERPPSEARNTVIVAGVSRGSMWRQKCRHGCARSWGGMLTSGSSLSTGTLRSART